MSLPATDFDSPWKEILERYFVSFLDFFFPVAHADIDWSRGYTFLDKELQQVTRDAEMSSAAPRPNGHSRAGCTTWAIAGRGSSICFDSSIG